MTESPEFQKLFVELFKDSERFNVKFEIGNVSYGANGNTNTDLNNPLLNTITISPVFLKNSNKMEIAKTIIHECIHAYLNVKLCDAGKGMSIPTLNNLDYYNVVNQKYNGFNGDQTQHNFIYNFMLPTMVTVLSEVRNLLVSPAEITSLEELSFHPTSPTVDVKFAWHDFYQNISLGGLQDCEFFKNEIATFIIDPQTGEKKAINIKDQVKLNYYNQYQSYAKIYLSKN